jgi:hypothetical protein
MCLSLIPCLILILEAVDEELSIVNGYTIVRAITMKQNVMEMNILMIT